MLVGFQLLRDAVNYLQLLSGVDRDRSCESVVRESRDLRVATCKFTLSDDNRERLARDSSLASLLSRERFGKRKLGRVIDTFRGHVARGRGIMQHPRDTTTLIIRGSRYRARLAVSLINRGDP